MIVYTYICVCELIEKQKLYRFFELSNTIVAIRYKVINYLQ